MALRYTAEQLAEVKPTTPTDWIISGLLRNNRRRPSLLCGFPGSGKSTLAHQLAIAVAQGEPFLGRPTMQGRVVYWANEESLEDAAEDFFTAGLKKADPLSLLFPQGDDSNFQTLMDELAAHRDTRLCVIETLADFLQVPDINNNNDCRVALQSFCDLVVAPNKQCSFLLLHHFNKSNINAELSGLKIQGGTAIAALTDTKIYLQQVSDVDTRRTIHADVRKGLKLTPTYLAFDEDRLTASLDSTVLSERVNARKAQQDAREDDLSAKILSAVSAAPGSPKSEIVKQVGGKAENVGRKVDELVEANFIVQKLGGAKGNAKLLYPLGHDDAAALAERGIGDMLTAGVN